MENGEYFYRALLNAKYHAIITHPKCTISLKGSAQGFPVYIRMRSEFALYRIFYSDSPHLVKVWDVLSNNSGMIDDTKHYFHARLCETKRTRAVSRCAAISSNAWSSSISSAKRNSCVALVARGMLSCRAACAYAVSMSGVRLIWMRDFATVFIRKVYQMCTRAVKL